VIISIGIDIIEVRRVRETIERTPRFAERVFTEAERTYCESRGVVRRPTLCRALAAKEAALKALQTGWSGGHRVAGRRSVGERVWRAGDSVSSARARTL